MGAMKVQCPLCKELFPVPTEVISTDGHQVIARMDRSEVFGHMDQCLAKAKPLTAPKAEPVKPAEAPKVTQRLRRPTSPGDRMRIGQFLEAEGFVSYGGSRACTMCGTNGTECLDQLRKEGTRPGCCPACHNGNTHPAPGEAVGSCAAWAAEKVGPNR